MRTELSSPDARRLVRWRINSHTSCPKSGHDLRESLIPMVPEIVVEDAMYHPHMPETKGPRRVEPGERGGGGALAILAPTYASKWKF